MSNTGKAGKLQTRDMYELFWDARNWVQGDCKDRCIQ